MKNNIYLMKPYFTMAYNNDPAILDEYKKLGINEIWAGVYMPDKSCFGSGRFQKKNTDKIVDYDELGKIFQKAKNMEFKTCFLLNPACSGNAEFTIKGMKEIKLISTFLNTYKIDYITLSQPFLAKVFKKLNPDTKIKLSSHYNCNTIGKFKFLLDDLDIDTIIISQFANKNFKLLKEITKIWNPERFEIICTVPCIMGCPMRNWHAQFYGHSISLEDVDYIPEYIPCLSASHYNKNIAVSSMFVRREDIKYYQKLGINKFKIGERKDTTENNIKYAEYYNGILEDYVPFFKKSKILNKMNLDAMDGFYDKFFNEECDGIKYDCHDCSYCDQYGEKVFKHSDKDIESLGIPRSNKEYFDNIYLKKWLDKFDELK